MTHRSAKMFKPYRLLLDEVAKISKKVIARYLNEISCHKGCGECCVLESVFAVEAHEIAIGLRKLSPAKKKLLVERANKHNTWKSGCIFLTDNACLIYAHRPVICRTHGYPLLANHAVDFCPKNFQGMEEIDSDCVFDLEKLNLRLAAVNLKFIREQKKPMETRIRFLDLISLPYIEGPIKRRDAPYFILTPNGETTLFKASFPCI